MSKDTKSNLSFRLPLTLRNRFQRQYPYCMSRFLVNCIKCALKDKQFFESVYFIPFEDTKE